MSKTNALHVNGIVPIVPTPFTIEELIDWPSLRRLVDFACATGGRAMCLPAYAIEFYKLSESETLQLVAEVVRQAAGRLPVLAQVNFVSLPQAVETAREVCCHPTKEFWNRERAIRPSRCRRPRTDGHQYRDLSGRSRPSRCRDR